MTLKIAPTFFIFLIAVISLASQAQTILDTTSSGQHEDLYFNFWKNNGPASMTLHKGGRYTTEFTSATNNWFGGLGWNPGGPRIVNYSGLYTPDDDANSYLTIYGWTIDPYVEYFVVESWGTWKPSNTATQQFLGSYESDGNTYDFFYMPRIPMGIDPLQVFPYYAIRTVSMPHGEVSGSINMHNHFEAWKQMGVEFGEHDYMIMATESYQSNGSSDITVSGSDSRCGSENGMPICCLITSDQDGDGIGEQFDGEICAVTETTRGWHPPNPDNVIAAINVGGLLDSVKVGDIWYQPNTYVSGATSKGTKTIVTNSEDNALFNTSGMGNMSIEIPVVGGNLISIHLGFAEVFGKESGERLIEVQVEGQAISQVDVAERIGLDRPLMLEPIITEVHDGTLNIELNGVIGEAVLSSLLVKKEEAPTTSSSSTASNDSSSAASSSGSENNETRGGSLNVWIILIVSGILLLRHKPLSLARRV